MSRRSIFLTLAAGLLASVAVSTPARANAMYLVDATVMVTGTGATLVEVDFNQAVTGPVHVVSTGLSVSSSSAGSPNPDAAYFHLSPSPTAGTYTLDFTLYSAGPPPSLIGQGGKVSGGSAGGGVSVSSANIIPEPASFALLGVGMTGLLAFRRIFRRKAGA